MICYASQTDTKRNLAAMREAGWRLMLSPKGHLTNYGFPYALDNGAWWAFQQQQPFDVSAFSRAVDDFGAAADWVVLPDIVGAGLRSLDFSLPWIERLLPLKVMLAVQDGMTPYDVIPHLSDRVGIFLGGTTEWKLKTMEAWGAIAAAVGVPYHVARVNTVRRVRLAIAAGATSIDGSSVTRYVKTLGPLDNASRGQDLFRPERRTFNRDAQLVQEGIAQWAHLFAYQTVPA